MVQFTCPKCQRILQAAEANAGKVVACPNCQAHLRVPRPVAPPLATPVYPGPPPPEPPRPGAPPWGGSRTPAPLPETGGSPSERLLRGIPNRSRKALEALGAPLAVSKPPVAAGITLCATGGFLLFLGLAPLPFALIGVILGKMRGGPSAGDPIWVPGSLMLSLIGASLLGAGLFSFRWRLVACEGGVAKVNGFGGTEIIRWGQISSAVQRTRKVRLVGRFGMTLGYRTDVVYTLVTTDRRRWVFTANSYRSMDQFWRIVQRETARVQATSVMEAIAREGREVEFGDLGVGPRGLRYREQLLPWGEVGLLSLGQRMAAVRRRDGKDLAAIPTEDIPDLHLFLQLVENLSGQRWT